jgi:hypothetical protein
LDSKLYQLIWNPLLTNYTHELMTAKQNTDNRHLKCLTLEESKYKWKSEKLLTLALKSFWLIYKSSNFSKYYKTPKYYNEGPRKLIILHTRLRHQCSSLNADLSKIHLIIILNLIAVGQQVIPTYMKSSPYKLCTWINDSKTKL